MKPYRWKINLGILGAYTLITIVVTYPAITALVQPYAIPGGGYDSTYFLWHLWWIKHALLNLGVWPTYTQSIFYPVGGVLLLASPFNELALISLLPLLGLTRTYSFLLLFSFPTAGFTTYLLAYYLTGNRWAAFVGGLIFAFSTYHYAHAIEHLGLWSVQWLPLYALALFLLLKNPSFKRAALTTASFVLAVASDHVYYLFYFVIPFTALFIIYHWLSKHSALRQRRYWLAIFGATLAGIVVLSPVYPHLLTNQGEEFIKRGDILFRSPDLMGYLTPARQHPVWQPLVAPLYEKMNKLDTEGAVFTGYVAISLMLLALWKQRNKTTRFWLWFGAIAFVFSLGPILSIYGPIEIPVDDIKTYVPLPYILVIYAPLIGLLRAPARLAVAVQLAVAVLAVCGADTLIKNWRSWWRLAGVAVLAILILFESLYQFPYPVNSSFTPPAIYQLIAQENNNRAVLEIPSRVQQRESQGENLFLPVRPISRNFSFLLMYYATVHGHPMPGGESSRTPTAPAVFLDTTMFIRELMYPAGLLENTSAIIPTNNHQLIERGATMLNRHNIGYVVVQRNLLDESERRVPELVLRQSLGTPFYEDDSFIGFRVPPGRDNSTNEDAFILGDGWYPKGRLYNRPVQAMTQTGSLLFYKSQPASVRLSVTAFTTLPQDAKVAMIVNGNLVDNLQIPPTSADPKTSFTRAFSLAKGYNEINFEVQPADTPELQPDNNVYLGVYEIAPLSILQPSDVSPANKTQISLGDKINLIGYDTNNNTLHGGDTLHLTLYWQVLEQMSDSYKVFIHLLDQHGNKLAQHDAVPHHWQLPTNTWGRGEVVPDDYSFAIPPEIPPGDYFIKLGLYNEATGERLTVANSSENSISIRPIKVVKEVEQ